MLVTVHRYRVYDILSDDYCTSTRMATAEKIAKIGGEIIPGTAYTVDTNELDDGWTGKNYTHILEQAAIDVIKRFFKFHL